VQSVPVVIVKFIDSHQPCLVECVLHDASGVAWTIVEKVPVVTTENLNATSTYPREGSIACEVIEDELVGSPLVRIDTSKPWGIEATDGTTTFVVRREQVQNA
jgi:hypothetical protein